MKPPQPPRVPGMPEGADKGRPAAVIVSHHGDLRPACMEGHYADAPVCHYEQPACVVYYDPGEAPEVPICIACGRPRIHRIVPRQRVRGHRPTA